MITNILPADLSPGLLNKVEPDTPNLRDCSYIEIPENINNFEQLRSYKYFNDIKKQYIDYMYELKKLYYSFTGLDGSTLMHSSINQINFHEEQQYATTDKVLFYSYKKIRKAIYSINSYLANCKSKQINNNKTAIICAGLQDCLNGICLDGFNSKIEIISNHIEYISSNDFSKQIKTKIKVLIQAIVSEFIIEQNQRINIHTQNYFFNLIAEQYSLQKIITNKVYIDTSIQDKFLEKIKLLLSKFNICKYIAGELYVLFKELLTKLNKEQWFNSDSIEDLTDIEISSLEGSFLDLVNNYLGIANTDDNLKISDIFIEKEESYNVFMVNIEDLLHFLVARHLDTSSTCFKKISTSSNIIPIDNNLNICNVNY